MVIHGFPHLLDEGRTEEFGGHAKSRIHETEAGREAQRQKSAQRVRPGKMIRRPVVAEGAVAAARDAADMAQPKGIDVGSRRQRPWPTLRPARHAELAISQRVGDGRQIVGPAGVGARFLGRRPSDAGPVHADQPQPVLRCRLREEARFEPATGSAMIVENQRSLRIPDLEIAERPAVAGCDRARHGGESLFSAPASRSSPGRTTRACAS